MNVNPFSYLIEKLKGKVDKSGDTMSGQLTIDQRNGTISDVDFSVLALGNSIASGTANNSTGIVDLYSDSGKKVRLYTESNISATRFVKLPNNSGTVALTSDITSASVSSQFTPDSCVDSYSAYKAGNIVSLTVKLKNQTYNAGATIMTLTDAVKPIHEVACVVMKSNDTPETAGIVYVMTGKTIKYFGTSMSGVHTFYITYMV